LRQLYHYHFINAEGPVSEVQANILKELTYQSSLELDPRTFERNVVVDAIENAGARFERQFVDGADGDHDSEG